MGVEFPFPGSLTSTFLAGGHPRGQAGAKPSIFFSSLVLSSLELSDTTVYEPQIRALLGTAGGHLRGQGAKPSIARERSMCSGSEAGSYLRLIDLCVTQL